MKKLTALLLMLALIISSIAILSSCGDAPDGGYTPSGDNGDTTPPDNTKPEVDKIVVPAYKDYGRGTVNYSDLTYKRPDATALIDDCYAVTVLIEDNKVSFDNQLSAIESLEDGYFNFLTMYSIANISLSKDSANSFWNDEYKYATTKSASLSQAIESIYIAAARSPHAERFEEEYFGDGLVEEYYDGGVYTDEVVNLMSEEASLESDYTSISTSNVIIYTYDGKSGTVNSLLADAAEKYGEGTTQYENIKISYMLLYEQAAKEKAIPIFLNLVKVRIRLAEAMGYESYTELAYENMGHDYSPSDMRRFASEIKDTVFPIYVILDEVTFYNYFRENMPAKLDTVSLVNQLYNVYKGMDPDISDVYSYMLQHGLYDIEKQSGDRASTSFTTYLYDNNSPFIFMSSSGYTTDYLTLSHEFGHFIDGYVNDGGNASIDLAEVSSQGFELLSLLALENRLREEDYEFLEYYELRAALNILLMQTFYAEFEHCIYELEYNEVSQAALMSAVKQASRNTFGVELSYTLSDMVIYHTVMMPHYVQSYSTSIIASLELFFMEIESDGAGLEAYIALVTRENEDATFLEQIDVAGLSSPFDEETLKVISDKIFFHIRGQHYFIEPDIPINAA